MLFKIGSLCLICNEYGNITWITQLLPLLSPFPSLEIIHQSSHATKDNSQILTVTLTKDLVSQLSQNTPPLSHLSLINIRVDIGSRLNDRWLPIKHLYIEVDQNRQGEQNIHQLTENSHRLETLIIRDRRRTLWYVSDTAIIHPTLRAIDIDHSGFIPLRYPMYEPFKCPKLTTLNINYGTHPHLIEILQKNPTITRLGLFRGTYLHKIAQVAPQIRSLKLHSIEDAFVLYSLEGELSAVVLPQLRELHIHQEDYVVPNLQQLMEYNSRFRRPRLPSVDFGNSFIEVLTITWDMRVCSNPPSGIEDWTNWLETHGYLDTVAVHRTRCEWKFSWTDTLQ
jgi:hypothetical protein